MAKTGSFCLDNCNGACCKKGQEIGVHSEAEHNALGGTTLTPRFNRPWVEPTASGYQGEGVYVLKENCPQLADGHCTIHEDPTRPQACQNAEVFDTFCVRARRR